MEAVRREKYGCYKREDSKMKKTDKAEREYVCPDCGGEMTYHKYVSKYRCNSYYRPDGTHKHSCGWYAEEELRTKKSISNALMAMAVVEYWKRKKGKKGKTNG